jgi:galactoside O-acetyltransferase
MTEKEKMLAGLLYDANFDNDLVGERTKCKDILFEYNNLAPSNITKQSEIIISLFGKTKGTFTITAPFYCDYGYNIEIGENFYTNHNCVILDAAKVKFGDNVFIAPLCGFYTAGHPVDAEQRNKGLEYAYPITIGNNVWIGGGVHVMPGVTIGDNTVIGAGSIVTKDIPSDVIAVGNPCKVLRKITDEDKLKYHKTGVEYER